jgi:hypothetical protein
MSVLSLKQTSEKMLKQLTEKFVAIAKTTSSDGNCKLCRGDRQMGSRVNTMNKIGNCTLDPPTFYPQTTILDNPNDFLGKGME